MSRELAEEMMTKGGGSESPWVMRKKKNSVCDITLTYIAPLKKSDEYRVWLLSGAVVIDRWYRTASLTQWLLLNSGTTTLRSGRVPIAIRPKCALSMEEFF